MPRMHQVIEKEKNGGWSDWLAPVLKRYRMACCDCGLVHDIDFRVVRVTKRKKRGFFEFERVPTGLAKGKFRVMMRTKRNKRSTAAMRRNRKEKNDGRQR